MEAKELRIGNWVLDDNKEQYQAKAITISLLDGGNIGPHPIPLTEEWLVKFGFGKEHEIDVNWQIDCGEYRLSITMNGFSGTLDKEPHWWFSIKTGYGSQPVTLVRDYVHSLQNLYFALTGKELIIK